MYVIVCQDLSTKIVAVSLYDVSASSSKMSYIHADIRLEKQRIQISLNRAFSAVYNELNFIRPFNRIIAKRVC